MSIKENVLPYDDFYQLRCKIDDLDIQYYSKPGLPSWDAISPVSQLFGKYVRLGLDNQVLLIGQSHGPLPAFLSLKYGTDHFIIADWNWLALNTAKETINSNGITNVSFHTSPEFPSGWKDAFDSILIALPKSRKLMQRWLRQAFSVLMKGGQLYVAGQNNRGIQSAIKDASELFGEPAILGYRKSCRIARWIKHDQPDAVPEWFDEPGIAPNTFQKIFFISPQGKIDLNSLPGIFSNDKIDLGSELLVSCLSFKPGSTVLDLGCGYGLLGIYASQSGAKYVDLVDSDLMAVYTAGLNIQALNIENAEVFPSDVLSGVQGKQYQYIVTNPPFHSGREIDYTITAEFINQSKGALLPGGELILVANKFLPYRNLLEANFEKVFNLAETNKYQVFVGKVN